MAPSGLKPFYDLVHLVFVILYIWCLYMPWLCIVLLLLCKMATNVKAGIPFSTIHLVRDMSTDVAVG